MIFVVIIVITGDEEHTNEHDKDQESDEPADDPTLIRLSVR
jgi:hypothetical protein